MLPVLLAMLLACSLRAQEAGSHPFYAGPMVCDIFGTPSIDRSVGAVVAFGTNGQGTSYDNAIMVGGRDLLPTLITPTIGLSSSISLGKGSGEFLSDGFAVLSPTANEQYRVTTSYAFIDLSSALQIPVARSLFARCGLYLNYQLSQSSNEQLEWIGSGASPFPNGASVEPVASGRSLTVPPLHFGMPFEFGTQIELPGEKLLQFAASARWDISETLRGYVARSWSAGLSATLLLPVSTIAPAHDVFVTAVHIRSVPVSWDAGDRSIVVGFHDTLVRRFLSLPSHLSALASSRAASPVPGFELSSLDRQPITEIAKQLANILALRTRENAADTLTLFSPLVNEWRERSYVLPTVDVEKNMYASRGIKDWIVAVTEGADTLASYRMHMPMRSNVLQFPSTGEEPSPILATLTVVDSTGAISIAHDTALLQYRSIDDRDSARIEEFWLDPARAIDAARAIDSARAIEQLGWDKKLFDILVQNASRASRIEVQPAFELGSSAREDSKLVERLLGSVRTDSKHDPKIEFVPISIYPNPPAESPFARWVRVRLFFP